jgi:hypothetical protein
LPFGRVAGFFQPSVESANDVSHVAGCVGAA